MEPGAPSDAAPPDVTSGAPADPSPRHEDAAAGRPNVPQHIVDLTLGAWRPREAARQLATGLGIALGPGLPPDPAASPVTTGRRGIDVSVSGDPIALVAHGDARRIASALPPGGTIVVLTPRHGRGIGTLNDWLFYFLRGHSLSLVVIGDEPATAMARSVFQQRRDMAAPPIGHPIEVFPVPQQRLLRLFPGLLPRAIAGRFGIDPAAAALVPVGPAHFLVPPGYRDTDPPAAAQALDAMEGLEAEDDGFKALAQTFCTAHFADSTALAALAGAAFHGGEIDLSRELSARARTVAREPAMAAAADLLRQEIRLHQRRFTEILATPEPSRRAPETTRAALATLRLRAAVERSEREAAPAGIEDVVSRLASGTAEADDLHLLCLHIEGRIGAGEGAPVAARAQQGAAAAARSGDERLVFLAARNQAILARRDGDRDAERRALVRAYATSDGARGFAEIAAMNALIAAAEDDAASPAARSAWLRAALAWLAFEPLEAFPGTGAEAILGTASVPRTQLDQRICDALAAALEKSSPGLAADSGRDDPPPAVRAMAAGETPTRLFGGPGAAALWAPGKAEGRPPSSSRLRLIGLALAALREACPAASFSGPGAVLVDDDVGTDLPATREASLAVALRAGVGEFLYGHERLTIDAASRPRLVSDLRVVLGPAVAAVSGPADRAHVRFRRHLDETTASAREAEVITAIRGGSRVTVGSLSVLLGTPFVETERLLRGLEGRRIVRVQAEAR
jgi:hypothetical protein